MKIEVGRRPLVDDYDDIKPEGEGGNHENLQQDSQKLALPCKNVTLGSTSKDKKGFKFLVEEVLKDNATTARSRALQQAVCKGVWQAQHLFQQRQQQAQPQHAAVVRWERFLPRQQLQVLLVEDDDATRHIVGALLRKCSYEVTPASNGLLAWELLTDQNSRVDLVLTEVVMPCLSGIGLLGRIMNHKALKHIPVIMMSSNDSMNVVFKCLSNGAVDFLVKPVRKNELKNLWQHVWRRCHSSSGSRSGSGSQTRSTARPKDVADLNNFGTNEDNDKTSSDLNVNGGSDNGSGTQSPWIKGGLEAESDCQVSKPHPTGLRTNVGLQTVVNLDDNSLSCPEHWKDKDLKVETYVAAAENASHLDLLPLAHENSGIAASAEDAHVACDKDNACFFSGGMTQAAEMVAPMKEQGCDEELPEACEDDDDDVLEKHASNIPSCKDKLSDLLEKYTSNSSSSKDKLSDSSFPSPNKSNNLQLSMKGSGEQEDSIRGIGGKGVIHSSASAFSRYHSRGNSTSLIARTGPANIHTALVGCGSRMPAWEGGKGGSHTLSAIVTSQNESITLCDSDAIKSYMKTNMEVKCLAQFCAPAKHGTLSKEDTLSAPLPPAPCSFSASKHVGGMHTVYPGTGTQVGESGETKDLSISYKEDELVHSHTNSYHQYHHHSHHHHHHHIQHHYYHVSDDKHLRSVETPQPNDQTVTNIRDGAPRCGSSNIANGVEGNLGLSGSSNGYGSNFMGTNSVNGSAIGSNNGSNGVQSVAEDLPSRGKDVSNPIDEENGSADVNGLTGLTEKCSATREVALNKFRQKRKERCFEKKVRYQSRKRLAEQRPRVRGQFVKQVVYDCTLGD